jgi:hypothetical protein
MCCHVASAPSAPILRISCVPSDDMQYKETNEVDPYVRLSLFDPTSGGTEAFRSTTQMNDASPRCTFHPHPDCFRGATSLKSCRSQLVALCTGSCVVLIICAVCHVL